METQIIDSFRGDYAFLSNYHPCEINFGGIIYPSIENAFQASKSVDPSLLKLFAQNTPGEAKARGNEIQCRKDWNEIKVQLMKDLLELKFKDTDLRGRLELTGELELNEGNWWHDNFWGECTCEKCHVLHDADSNTLGKLLMKLRTEIRRGTDDIEKM